jgi:phage antirepressor YoqD-like protein
MSEVIMHKIMNVSNSPMMSSKEIADITGKDLSHVHRDIKKMLSQLEADKYAGEKEYDRGSRTQYKYIKPSAIEKIMNIGHDPQQDHEKYQEVKDYRGYISEILLDHDLTILLMTGYDVKARLKVIQRWKELEQQVEQPQFAIPTSLSGALMLAAQQAEQIEKQQAVIAQQAPAVAFVERFVEADGLHNVRQTAKALEIPEKEFVSRCIAAKILYRTNKALTGYQQWKDAGYLTHKEDEINGKARLQVMFTPKGIAWLGKRLIKAQAQIIAFERKVEKNTATKKAEEPPHLKALAALGIRKGAHA